jgi:hypothetical protein
MGPEPASKVLEQAAEVQGPEANEQVPVAKAAAPKATGEYISAF